MNLISNAFKFTNYGRIGVFISIMKAPHLFEDHRILRIEVEDTGIGISEQDQTNLFKIFGMVRRHRDEFNVKGSGLGLTIWEKLVKSMKGKIHLTSAEGIGTKVTFTILEKVKQEKKYHKEERK